MLLTQTMVGVMNRINPRILGIVMALGGVCVALPFQQLSNRKAPLAPARNSESIEWRSQDFTLEVTAQGQPLTNSPYAEDHPKSPAFGGGGGLVANARASLDNVAPPPPLAGAYDATATPRSTATNGLRDDDRPRPDPTGESHSSVASTSQLPSVAIKHELTDGDTLQALAEKHLGSRLRWTEIYNANPEILSDPEVLPLGVTIVILPGIQPRNRARVNQSGINQADSLVPVSRHDLERFRGAND